MTDVPSPDALFSPLIEHAIELSAQWHDGTYRKSVWRDPAFEVPEGQDIQIPVMAHLAAVASIVHRAGWDEVTVAAAYLHDTIEDMNEHGQRLRRKQLREAVGAEVAKLVAQVSEQKLDEEGEMLPWRDRKEDYLTSLRDGSPEGAAISLADKIHNLWSINQSLESGEDILTVLSGDREAQDWFHRAVLEASKAHDDSRLVPMRERLQQEIERFEAHE
ncbi:phosphohydrolase [Salinibacter sp. 10B]|uniref:HD domain-containing protein n=1 Tax=Salinibacter sp. 10B TaxID=1923971 RepID=UPI000CF3DD64|nr:HD domain-containing protein [Salinibacter sp. 10B]PQJ36086.1 phosphohydrolase [Salinibacter sp. 10B]